MQISIIIPQAISPALTTSLYAYSVNYDILGGYFVWVALFAMSESNLFQMTWVHSNHRLQTEWFGLHLYLAAFGAIQAQGLEEPVHIGTSEPA